jgi:regulation of enolase protein 1 (concanavalin A-like superfamily)
VTTNEFSDWSTHNLGTSKYLTFDWRITKTKQAYLTEVQTRPS